MTGRQRRRAFVAATACACTALLLAGLTGCGGEDEAEAGAAPRSEHPIVTSTPEVTEPPWETDLTLSSTEKKAVDEAYETLTDYSKAYSQVLNDGGNDPDRALQLTTGKQTETAADDFAAYREAEEYTRGVFAHRRHEVVKVDVDGGTTGSGRVLFESCIDPTEIEVLNAEGDDMKAKGAEPYLYEYTVERTADGWKQANERNMESGCE